MTCLHFFLLLAVVSFPEVQFFTAENPVDKKIYKCVCFSPYVLISARGVTERHPSFMYPTGTSSSQMVLRGEDLLLECIASGVYVPLGVWFTVQWFTIACSGSGSKISDRDCLQHCYLKCVYHRILIYHTEAYTFLRRYSYH